ncbi:hypothetical protein [Halobacteriovorax sp. ZH4_bin.1]|uniref:hypothetical protein n=1 Tax=unclassified Halobacteriovorax TaxID=2639665 RepID=UPI0037156E46
MNPVLTAKREAKKFAKLNGIPLKQAQKQLAYQNGYSDWKSYKNRIDTFWYQKSSPFLTHWFAKYSEAKNYQKENGGYLLTFRGQFFVAQKEYILHMGLDPDDSVWELIDFDVSSNNSLEKFFKYQGKLKRA